MPNTPLTSPQSTEDARLNLQDLRRRLAGQLAWLAMGAGGAAGVLSLAELPPSQPGLTVALAGVTVGLASWIAYERLSRWTCHILTAGLLGVALLAMATFDDAWLPLAAVPLVAIGGALVRNGDLLAAAVLGAGSFWLAGAAGAAGRDYPLPGLLAALAFAITAGRLSAHMLHSALRSAWDAQAAADRLLAEARERQAELAGTLKSLELATYQLETANHKLFVARRLTEEARRAKEQFAANISHELRTPLNVILGFSEMMYVSPEVYGEIRWPTPLRQDVYQIYRSSRHLLAMIDDVLELSRFELSEFNLHREQTAIEPLVNSAVEIVRGLFRDRPIRLEVEVAVDLPAVEADRTRIRQVLINLLTNARNHTKAGGVRVSAQPDAGEIVFCVADTGPGIPPDKVNRIFDAFFQVDSGPRRERSGTGLGLAISKHFVEAHGGRIWVESREGIGTSVYFALPMPEVGVPTLYPAETGSREPAWSNGRPGVLVVDPDPAVAGLISRHLGGYDVTRVDDSRELSEALGARQPRIAILNVPPQSSRRGPGQSDTRLLDALAGSPEWRTPETAATTLIECSLPSRSWIAADLRVAGCLTKPVAAEQIHAAIERIGGVADVLVVDDDRGFAQLIERILAARPHPMRVRIAYDGEEGLAAMRNRPPDLVFLDLAMPVLNGFQVLDAMEKDARMSSIPVILLTVTSYAEDVLREHGCRITVDRPGGVNLRAALRYMRAIADASEPVTPDPGPGAPPADPPG